MNIPVMSSNRIPFYLNSIASAFHPNEKKYLQQSIPPSNCIGSDWRLVYSTRLWTMKEALLKCKGVGIGDPSQPLHQVDFSTSGKMNDDTFVVCAMDRWVCCSWYQEKLTSVAVAIEYPQKIIELKVTGLSCWDGIVRFELSVNGHVIPIAVHSIEWNRLLPSHQ